MRSQLCVIFFVVFAALLELGDAKRKCIWAIGVVKCKRDPSKQGNVDVIAYDRDGPSIFQLVDPDDMMGRTLTDEDGTFKVEGCGSDFDWFPGITNLPDPYVTITHYCNKPEGETIELPEFYTFVPNTHDFGEIELDDPETKPHKNNHQEVPYIPPSYRTVSRNKEIERKAELDRLTKMLKNGGSHIETHQFKTTPHVGIDDESWHEELDNHDNSDRDKTTKAAEPIDNGKWKEMHQRERERYTFQNADDNDEITTVTLPDRIALSKTRRV